jgi:hypothetical protein
VYTTISRYEGSFDGRGASGTVLRLVVSERLTPARWYRQTLVSAPKWLLAITCAIGILCAPTLALAQMGMGGGGGGGHSGSDDKHPLDPHIADLIRATNPDDPTSFLLAARTDLKLSDSEVTALYTVRMMLQSHQQAAHNALDTLGPNAPISSIDWAHITPAGRDSLIAHREAVASANGQLRDAAIAAQKQALAILTPEQQGHLIDLQRHVEEEKNLPHDSTDAATGGGRHH